MRSLPLAMWLIFMGLAQLGIYSAPAVLLGLLALAAALLPVERRSGG